MNLDGSLREGSTFPMAVAGNPYERAWRGEWKHNGIHLDLIIRKIEEKLSGKEEVVFP